MYRCIQYLSLLFFNDTATTEIYTLSLHDALPISSRDSRRATPSRRRSSRRDTRAPACRRSERWRGRGSRRRRGRRSEEHTSELQSRQYLVCRLLLEKKKIQHLFGLAETTTKHNVE